MVNLRHALTHARHGAWEQAHGMVQDDQSLLGAWLHGMAHIAEQDLANAAYWYARAGRNFAGRGDLAEELDRFEAELQD
ncbi:MAG: hypothetical protein IPO35_19070 [Uliginosibacterium sp.]|jgi:hypothetical protein|nr:hypothetical protein [Uliginosibacterium sp.]MBK9394387.1 hypothetical protein [Uliginosibacterium sp.]MBK9617492.1 hypothetical protein [Uliginosibacterium sp.]